MPTMLFCNIARMDSYRGRISVDVPHGAGRNRAKEEVHNFLPYGAHVYGYVAAPNRSIDLEKLGADNKEQLAVSGVDVIWTAPSPGGGRYVVGWYRDATVFYSLQEYERGLYHVQASKTDYVLLPPNKRGLVIKSAKVQRGGFGRKVWYADTEYGQNTCIRVTGLFRRAKRQVFDRDELDGQADAIEKLDHAPPGVGKPSRSKREINVLGRDPEVQRWILQCADGHCELCGKQAPFVTPKGNHILEIHHVRRLADGGADVPQNAVALCDRATPRIGSRSSAASRAESRDDAAECGGDCRMAGCVRLSRRCPSLEGRRCDVSGNHYPDSGDKRAGAGSSFRDRPDLSNSIHRRS